MANEYIRHLTENGVWQFSNVKSVGELYELKTKTKVDIVSSINELHSHYQLNSEGISNIFDTVKDLNEIIGDLDTSLKEEKDKLIDLAKDLADSSSELTSDMKNIKSELEGKLTTADGKIADIYDKAQELQLKFDKDSVIVNGKLTDIEQEIITTKDEVSSKLSKTEFDNAVGVNKWVASFYNMTGDRYATAYPQLEDVSGMTASYVEEMNDSVKLYPFTSPKNGLLHLFTNVRMSAEKTITLNIEHSKGMAVLLNGGYIYYKAGDATGNVSISLRSGWNTIEILLGVHNSVGAMNATSKISDLVGKMTSVIGVGGKDETRLVHNETMIKQTNEKISLKADSTVVSQLGNQVESNTAQLEVQSGQIATKVSSEEMNKYTGRLSTAETNIIQQSEKIELLATKDEVDTLNGKVSSNSSSITQLNESIAIKASKDELSTVDGKVTSAVGRIDVLQGEVALKASKSELDTVTNNVTQNTSSITAQAGEIALKASKSEVDAVSNRVKNAETSITSNASAIELKASKGELDTLTGRVGSAEASLKVQSDQIASKVGTTELVSYKQDTGTSQDFSVVNKKIKNVGWHRIASNSGNRAFAEFELVDRTSGSQATAIFNAGIMFGRNPTFTLNGFSNYSVNPFPKVRILYKGVYDVVYIDVYINKSPTVEETDTSIYVRKNNQLRGWVDSQLIEATIPEGYTSKEFHIDNSNLVDATSQNTSKDTANVNGVPSATVTDKIVKYETEISQTKEAIELKASKSEVYAIKTGSKNLLSLSNDNLFSLYKATSAHKATMTKDKYMLNIAVENGTGVEGVRFLSKEIDLESNAEYVFSYKFRVNSGTVEQIGGHADALFSNWVRLYYDSVLYNSTYGTAQKIPNINDGNWHSVQYVFKTPKELVEGYIHIQPNRSLYNTNFNVDIKDIQMEKGNIISDWKPSLVDSSGETENVIIGKVEASLKVQADQISSKVTQLEVDATVVEAVNGIEIGGTNLIEDSDFAKGTTANWRVVYGKQLIKDGVYEKTFTENHSATRLEYTTPFTLTNGETYTFSIYAITPKKLDWRGFVNATIISFTDIESSPTSYKKYAVTFKATADSAVTIRAYTISEVNDVYKIDKYKLEKGNKATDWSASPIDIENRVVKNESEIKQTKDAIELKVSKDYLSGLEMSDNLVNTQSGWEVGGISATVGSTQSKTENNYRLRYFDSPIEVTGGAIHSFVNENLDYSLAIHELDSSMKLIRANSWFVKKYHKHTMSENTKYIRVMARNIADTSIKVADISKTKFSLVKGDIYQSWKPSQKDTDTKLLNTQAKIDIQSDQIASKVEATELVSYKQQTGTSQDFSVMNKKIKNVGWYRIASTESRAFAEFELVDKTSGSQATAIFNAGIMFGRNPSLVLNGFSNHSVNPFPKVRILYKGIYDVVYIDVYINKPPAVAETDTSVYVRKNNQNYGWANSQLIEATIPEGHTSKEFYIDNSNIVDATSQNTSKDTANVNGVPSATVTDKIIKYETEILQNKEAIELKASKSEMYGIKTGSKNLLSLSNKNLFSAHGVNNSTKITKDNYTINIDTKQSTGVDGIKFLSREIDLEPNTEYVFSYKFRVNSGTLEVMGGHTDALFSNWYRLYYDSVLSSSHYNVAQKIPNMNDGNWHSVQYVFKTPSKIDAGYIYIQPNRVATKLESNVDIKDIQMEKGNIISDWKPSLVDSSGDTEKVITDKMEASFKVQADQISSKVSQVEVDKSIGDISIGGRNLFKDSKIIEMNSNNNVTAPIDRKVMNDEKEHYIRHIPLKSVMSLYIHLHTYQTIEKLEKGKTYTISLMARAVDVDINASIFVRDSTSPAYESSTVVNPVSKGIWSNVSVTFTPNRDILSYHIVLRTNKGTTLDSKLFKLEEGNKATAWTPAPEEVDAKIAKNESEIKQTKDAIELKVSKDYLSGLEMSDNLVNTQSGWEVGEVTLISNKPQNKVNSATRLRYFDNPIEVTSGAIYSLVNDNLNYAIAIHELDSDMNFIVDGGWLINRQHKRIMSKNTKYIRLYVRATATLSSTKVTLDDISKTKFSLVKGDIYQSWKPSQKDVDTKLLKTEAKIDIQANQILSKVEATEFVSYKNNTGTSNDFSASRDVSKTGWYRIAYNAGDRAFAEFEINNTTSGQHATATFIAGIMYGKNPTLTLTGFSVYGTTPFPKARIVYKGTYDPVYIDLYCLGSTLDAYPKFKVNVRKNNQTSGWLDKQLIAVDEALLTGYSSKEFAINLTSIVDVTSQNTSKDTSNVNGVPSATITDKIVKYETEILQTKEAIELKASKSEVDAITGSLNHSYAGANLLEGSDTDKYKKKIDQTFASYNQFIQFNINHVDKKIKIGDIITISFDIQMEKGTVLSVYDDNNNRDMSFGRINYSNIGSDKTRLYWTFTVKKGTGKETPNHTIDFYNHNNGDRFTIENIKIEKGSIGTAWDLSPEEKEKRIANTEAILKVQADQISSKVTSSNVADLINSNARIKDTRDTNENPAWYWTNHPYKTVEELKLCKVLGLGDGIDFALLTTSAKWINNSGGKIIQTAVTDYKSFERKSKSNTEWEEWVQLVDRNVMGTYVTQTIDSWGVDVVRNGNVISKINASTEGVTIAGDKVNIRGNTTFTNAETDIIKAKKIAMLTGSKLLYEDVKFEEGTNGVRTYNNHGNGNVIISRITKPSDCPTKSTHALEIKTIGSASPSNGGIYQPVMSRADAKFLVKYLAKLPIGYFFQANTNSMGSGYTDEWLTPTVGTGRYTEYIRLVSCGTTGTFNNGGHLSVVGKVATAEAPLIWYLGSIEAYDLSDYQALPTSAQDTIDIADTWRTTGKTTIDGGMITADSVTSAQIVAGSITSDELNAKAIDGMVVTGATFRTSAYASSNGGVVIDSNGISGYNTSGTKKFSLGATGTLSATDVIISGTLNAGASSTFAGNVETEKDIIIGNNIYLRKGASFADAQKRLYFDYIDTSNTGYTWIQGNRLGMTLNANNITLSTGVAGTSIDLEGAVRTSLSKSFNFNRTSGYAFEVNYRPALFTNGLVVNGGTVNFTGATVTGVTATFG